METRIEHVGEYTIIYTPELNHATVTRPGMLVPELVHREEGEWCFEICVKWAEENSK